MKTSLSKTQRKYLEDFRHELLNNIVILKDNLNNIEKCLKKASMALDKYEAGIEELFYSEEDS